MTQVGQYKGKIESLKALISVSDTSNIPTHQILNENQGNSDPLFNTPENRFDRANEDGGIKPFEESSFRKNLTASANARIVKLIKGGGKANSIFYVLKCLNQLKPIRSLN